MADPNMSDFQRRVQRLQEQRAKGHGFEAAGTLGRSHYTREVPKRRSLLAPILLIVSALFLVKTAMILVAGRADYEARVERMMAGQGLDAIGGWLMQVDPLSGWLAGKAAPYLPPR